MLKIQGTLFIFNFIDFPLQLVAATYPFFEIIEVLYVYWLLEVVTACNYVSPHLCGETYRFCPVRLSVTVCQRNSFETTEQNFMKLDR